MTRFTKNTLVLGSALAMIAIVLGAFAAHGLRPLIEPSSLDVFKTGVTYHFYHALAILIIGLAAFRLPEEKLRWPVICMAIGVLCFSGSLYLISTSAVTGLPTRFLGPITPLGGLLMIAGWALFIRQIIKEPIVRV